MKYSKEEVMQYIQEEDVKFIRLAFCDVFGKQKNISIMPEELSRAFDCGIAIDASAIAGFGDENHSDLFLHPDADTLMPLPWRPEHGRVVRMFCTITRPDGSIFECDTRSILKKAVQDAQNAGFQFFFGSEQEFYLFCLDDNGNPTKEPYDQAGYMDIAPEDRGENIRREVCLTLEQMGIQPESSHHEEGPGQNEIDFRYSDPLTAADNAMTFQTVVKTIARRNGLFADFSPKPLKDRPGNGFHINISVKSTDDADYMSYMIAAILDKVADMTMFLNPTENSYQRFGSNKAPRYISWSSENRSQLIRVPAAVGKYQRAELRSPDPSTNTYLTFALLIYAILDGIQNKLELPEPADINLYKADADTLARFKQLPGDFKSACAAAVTSSFVKKHIPDAILSIYCSN
ncbi:glutamine synthetase family protein [Parablautia sp. Marseille-Q6255]|uniref:glutamine synthetase family protein n=1 Tax=Parablautia sp. Marseille-Q6255 TaxID=3039593 RepID=UPI0024BCF4C8|nr:glutamine synthetase family protein [Parablautia sp. Marseille-Q6255]